MREILFRGLRADNNEWVYGDLIAGFYICKSILVNPILCNPIQYIANQEIELYEIISESIGQYTGVVDKSDVKIFEGDACRCTRSYWDNSINLIVKYDDDSAGFFLYNNLDPVNSEKFDRQSMFLVSKYNREVIGNIHDNPELLS